VYDTSSSQTQSTQFGQARRLRNGSLTLANTLARHRTPLPNAAAPSSSDDSPLARHRRPRANSTGPRLCRACMPCADKGHTSCHAPHRAGLASPVADPPPCRHVGPSETRRGVLASPGTIQLCLVWLRDRARLLYEPLKALVAVDAPKARQLQTARPASVAPVMAGAKDQRQHLPRLSRHLLGLSRLEDQAGKSWRQR
jgi:hypothetical protein